MKGRSPTRRARSRALGLALGYALDRAVGDPPRLHPVGGFGRAAIALERRTYADGRAAGVTHAALLVGGAAALGRVLPERTVVVAACTWAVLGGRSLAQEALAVHGLLTDDDLPGARRRLTHLVGRDTTTLEASEISRAVLESVAENTSDAVVAPLLWGAVAGPAGLLAYRAANTLDAMVGHLSPHYARFGWAAARLDDVLNLVPARVTAALAAAFRPGPAIRAWQRDAHRHPSPNAGPVEAAFAGALGVRLGGSNRYGDHIEDRGLLGDGRTPQQADVVRAVRLANRVDLLALGLAIALAWARAQTVTRRAGTRRLRRIRPRSVAGCSMPECPLIWSIG